MESEHNLPYEMGGWFRCRARGWDSSLTYLHSGENIKGRILDRLYEACKVSHVLYKKGLKEKSTAWIPYSESLAVLPGARSELIDLDFFSCNINGIRQKMYNVVEQSRNPNKYWETLQKKRADKFKTYKSSLCWEDFMNKYIQEAYPKRPVLIPQEYITEFTDPEQYIQTNTYIPEWGQSSVRGRLDLILSYESHMKNPKVFYTGEYSPEYDLLIEHFKCSWHQSDVETTYGVFSKDADDSWLSYGPYPNVNQYIAYKIYGAIPKKISPMIKLPRFQSSLCPSVEEMRKRVPPISNSIELLIEVNNLVKDLKSPIQDVLSMLTDLCDRYKYRVKNPYVKKEDSLDEDSNISSHPKDDEEIRNSLEGSKIPIESIISFITGLDANTGLFRPQYDDDMIVTEEFLDCVVEEEEFIYNGDIRDNIDLEWTEDVPEFDDWG
jgi:hypothetical protein